VLCNEIETQYEKNNVLQLGLQLPFWVAMTICNSLYFYTHEWYWTSCMSCKLCNSMYIQSHFSATHCNLLLRTSTHTKLGITLKASELKLLRTTTHTKLGITLKALELESITQQLTQNWEQHLKLQN
jgi:hypothetical protein